MVVSFVVPVIVGVLLLLRRRHIAPGVSVRSRILSVLSEVVPSAYPDARFRSLAPAYDPTKAPWSEPGGPTTCGFLPWWVGNRIGVRITGGGTYELRDVAKAAGAWIEPGNGRRPSPGDPYAVGNDAGSIDHVGFIVKLNGDDWTTADAGQGPRERQGAAENVRKYDRRTNRLGTRRLVGWMDVAKYVAAKGGLPREK